MKRWHKISLPARWKVVLGYNISNQGAIYEAYFNENNIKWEMFRIDNESEFLNYRIKVDDEQLVTYIKLKMSL